MRLLNPEEYKELNEMFILSKATEDDENLEIQAYNYAEWMVAFTQVINVAGVDTFCESLDDIDHMMEKLDENFKTLAKAANQVLFKHVINIKAAKKVLQIKYDGYREAAENYVEASLDASLIRDEDRREKTRIALLLSYEKQIKNIDAIAHKTLSKLKLVTPSIERYEKLYKWRYQYSLYNLGVNSGVSVQKMKAHDDRVSQLKKNIDKMSKEVKAGEELINSKNPDYLYFSDDEQDEYDNVVQHREEMRQKKEEIKLQKKAEKEEKKQLKIDRKAEREQAKIDKLQRKEDIDDVEADAIEAAEKKAAARDKANKAKMKRAAKRKRTSNDNSLWKKLQRATK